MKLLVVLSFDLPDPEAVATILEAIDPPSIPHFAGEARIVVDPSATAVTDWLDGDGELEEKHE